MSVWRSSARLDDDLVFVRSQGLYDEGDVIILVYSKQFHPDPDLIPVDPLGEALVF